MIGSACTPRRHKKVVRQSRWHGGASSALVSRSRAVPTGGRRSRAGASLCMAPCGRDVHHPGTALSCRRGEQADPTSGQFSRWGPARAGLRPAHGALVGGGVAPLSARTPPDGAARPAGNADLRSAPPRAAGRDGVLLSYGTMARRPPGPPPRRYRGIADAAPKRRSAGAAGAATPLRRVFRLLLPRSAGPRALTFNPWILRL